MVLSLSEKAGRKVLMVSGLSLMLCMTILLLASLLTFVSLDQDDTILYRNMLFYDVDCDYLFYRKQFQQCPT